MIARIGKLIAIWLLLTIGSSAAGLGLMLIVLVHRYTKNLEEVLVAWLMISLCFAAVNASLLGLLIIRRGGTSLIIPKRFSAEPFQPDPTGLRYLR